MPEALAAYVHYLSIFALFALLTLEHVMFRGQPSAHRARRLIRLDRYYGLCAIVVIVTGAARLLWFAKGTDYYLHNLFFHIKIALYLGIGLVSIYPTLTFLSWRSAVAQGAAPRVEAGTARAVMMCIRLELAMLVLMPLCAVMMARGYGAW